MASIKKNYLYNTVSEIISLLVPFLLVPYTSRTLGAENIGIYSFSLSIVTVFSSFGRLGLNTYGKLQVSQNRDNRKEASQIVAQLLFLRLLISLIDIAVYILYVLAAGKYKEVGMVLTIVLVSDLMDVSWIYQGLEEFKYIAQRTLFIRIANLVLVLLFVRGRDDLLRYVLIMHLTQLFINVSMVVRIKRLFEIQVSYFKFNIVHLKRCIVYFIPTIANLIYNMLDKVMLGYLGQSAVQSGFYEQSYKIVHISQNFLFSIALTTLPQLTYFYKQSNYERYNDLISKSMRALNMVIFPMTVGLLVNASDIVMAILGDEFEGSVIVLQCLSILLLFATFNYNIGNELLISTERQKEYNTGVICGAVVNLICNIILIRQYKAFGAALGSVIAEVFIFCIFMFYVRNVTKFSRIFNSWTVKYLLLAVIMGIIDVLVSHKLHAQSSLIRLIIIVPISIAFYFISLLAMKDGALLSLLSRRKQS